MSLVDNLTALSGAISKNKQMITSGVGRHRNRLPNRLLERYTEQDLMGQNQLAIGQVGMLLAPQGRELTRLTDADEWNVWKHRAARAGNKLPHDRSIGRIITAAEAVKPHMATIAYLTLLNDAIYAMPLQQGGHYMGRSWLQITALKALRTQVANLHYDIFSNGRATLSHATLTVPLPPEPPAYRNYLADIWNQLRLDEITDFPEKDITIQDEPIGPNQIFNLGRYIIERGI